MIAGFVKPARAYITGNIMDTQSYRRQDKQAIEHTISIAATENFYGNLGFLFLF